MNLFAHLLLSAFLFLFTLSYPGSCQQECETPVELGFLVDESGSITVENFEKVKDFILTVIAGFDISREGTHIGIIKYSTNATTILRFNEFEDPNFNYENLNQTLQKALARTSKGKTRIDLALEKADKELFADVGKYRSFVPKILLVLTDGQQTRGDDISDRDVFAATKSLSTKGVEVYALGVGDDVNIPELLQIATDKDANVFLAEDFDDLSVQVDALLKSFCRVCRRDLDVAFLIPTATSVGERGLDDTKQVIDAILSTFKITKYNGVHIGFLTCAEFGDIAMKFDDHHEKKEIQNVLKNLKLRGRNMKLENCLKDASLNLFDVRGGVRNIVDKYLIVIGDGKSSFSQQAVRKSLSTLKYQGVKVMTWARSSNRAAIAKMAAISSEPKNLWARQMQRREIENAGFFARTISEIICKQKQGKCPYTEIPETCSPNDVIHECDSDKDSVSPCPEERKCCQIGCERQCLKPVADCFHPVEIAIVVDTSGTRGAIEDGNTLTEFKLFAKQLVHSFSITETAGRVAIVTYNNESKLHKGFGSEPNFFNVEQKMKSVALSNKAERNLAEALEFTRENVFSLKGGVRQGVQFVLIVLSTGQPTITSSRLSQAASSLKQIGVQIWGVHAGRDSSSYMDDVVSQRSFFKSSLNELDTFNENLVTKVCSIKVGTCRRPLCPRGYQVLCTDDYLCPGQQKCCPGICNRCVEPKTECNSPMDLAFIVQDSLDIKDFEKVKGLIKGVMDALDVGRTQTWIGVISFNARAKIELEFSNNQGNSIEEKRKYLFDQIDKLRASPGRSTKGAEGAFVLAKNRLFTAPAGSHIGEIRSAVFISKGKFSDTEKVKDASSSLGWDIDNLLQVVIDKNHDISTIKRLASAPQKEKHVYLATSYDALDHYINSIALDSCGEGTGVKPTKPPLIMVKGPVGDAGTIGATGVMGRVGLVGRRGSQGDFGLSGEPGLPGEIGKPGVPGQWGVVGQAGEVIIERGEKGPISDVLLLRSAQLNLSSLVAVHFSKDAKPGPRGQRGSKGQWASIGEDGIRGTFGEVGFCGDAGPTGNKGRNGIAGVQGNTGYLGQPGELGLPGPKGGLGDVGNLGRKGGKGPPGDQGEPGLKGVIGEVGDRGEPGLSGDLGNPGGKGSKGLPGTDGVPGFSGFNGRKGGDGEQGIPGEKGEKGPMGIRGNRGHVGAPGFVGSAGVYGIVGVAGLDGEDGESGKKGRAGAMGIRGKEGPLGNTGQPGGQGNLGLNGPQGSKGSKGLLGDSGVHGSDGETGDAGKPGSDGDIGDLGENGEPGTRADNGENGVQGKLGDKGSIGIPGRRGIEGPPGPRGESGPVGRLGLRGRLNRPGLFGDMGISGEKGERGDSGFPGTTGKRGEKGYPGDEGEPGFPGTTGQSGLPGSDGSFGFHGAHGESGLIGIPGPTGPNGPPGPAGQDGDAGTKGLPGKKGFPGPPGFPGPAGVAAPPGAIGVTGKPGERSRKGRKGQSGFPGNAGEDGDEGEKGEVGSQGYAGRPGPQGEPGVSGDTGEEGDKGVAGLPGSPGNRGKIRPDGPKGISGDPGAPGKPGVLGVPGSAGEKGIAGEKGGQGDIGRQGQVGTPGRNGYMGENGPAWLLIENGVKGLKGTMGGGGNPGKPGTAGAPGQPGVQGPPGQLGNRGLPGISGTPGSPGGDGNPGQKGPTAEAGVPGFVGIRGEVGLPGGQGLEGPRGSPGPKGTPGSGTLPGEPGLRGSKGFPGTIGVSGISGRKGRKGIKGPIGYSGDKGERGTQGIVGASGANGEPGEAGTKGTKGKSGATGEAGLVVNGDSGPPGPTGRIGDPGQDGEPGEPGENGKEGMPGIQGAQGLLGDNGAPGPGGNKGTTGPAGAQGEASAKGSKGLPGSSGQPGKSVDGTLGPAGPPGSPGVDGLSGLKGEKGKAGILGPNGPTGHRGENGTSALIGDPGKVGIKGVKGDIGKPGLNASKGEKGEKGKIGLPGPGEKGEKGIVGFRGPDGANGEPGSAVKGPMGPQGNPGKKGIVGGKGLPGPPGPQGPYGISFNGTTITFRYNESDFGYIQTGLEHTSISKRYSSLQLNLALHKKPNGSKTFPAITCGDLFKHYPTLESGQYWIDPNGGAYEDAEKVYCDFENNATCLAPMRKKIKNKKWFNGTDEYKWFTEELDDAKDTDKFDYAFDVVQLQMLQLQSNEAWQQITYHCLNSVAWSNTSAMIEHSIRLQGDDDLEFHNQMPRKLQPTTIEDNCQIKDGQWNKTIIEVRSLDPIHLPIRDVAVYDVGDDGEEFGLELGRVCFTAY